VRPGEPVAVRGVEAARLSRLFLLEGAMAPVLELVEAATAPGRA
jgi:hypothetical protein